MILCHSLTVHNTQFQLTPLQLISSSDYLHQHIDSFIGAVIKMIMELNIVL